MPAVPRTHEGSLGLGRGRADCNIVSSVSMPGLINKAKRSALPLSASDITSCVRGYTLAMTASLTYENIEDHPVEGIFIYPLEEGSVVVGFEAMISSQIITVQIKDKAKIDDCYVDSDATANGDQQGGGGLVLLDEDLECVVLVVNLGLIPPLETVNVLVSTSSELSTLSNGGIRVTTPPVCTPRVQYSVKEEQAFSPTSRSRDRHHCAPGSHEQTLSTSQLCLARLLEEESINSIDYEFNFQLEIRGPYLLAGVESPSHAIRADADPSACSATSILVTLADKYTYDCPVEILIYPSGVYHTHAPYACITHTHTQVWIIFEFDLQLVTGLCRLIESYVVGIPGQARGSRKQSAYCSPHIHMCEECYCSLHLHTCEERYCSPHIHTCEECYCSPHIHTCEECYCSPHIHTCKEWYCSPHIHTCKERYSSQHIHTYEEHYCSPHIHTCEVRYCSPHNHTCEVRYCSPHIHTCEVRYCSPHIHTCEKRYSSQHIHTYEERYCSPHIHTCEVRYCSPHIHTCEVRYCSPHIHTCEVRYCSPHIHTCENKSLNGLWRILLLMPVSCFPSPELHLPHVLIEDGDMTREEYDEHLMGRSDYIRATKKDSSNEKKVDIIHKRLHKDILHNPVVMLNFCPDLQSMTSDLTKVQGEFVFLIDRSGSMNGVNISRVKDAMLVILKSLFPACMFNIVGFGTTFKPLFATSQNYNEESLATACNHVKKIRADMGGTNILAPLDWVLRQPGQRGHPRELFLLTGGAVSNTGKVIALVRSHAPFTRCYVFGMGQACRRLGSSLAAVSRGCAEFLADGERLQPKMIKCLRKSMAPVLSDISIEWFYPETKEVLLSPVGTTYLFPGDRLMGYSVVCDTTRYHPNPKSDKRRRYSMMRSNESSSSVFYHSQEEELGRSGCEGQAPPRDTPATAAFDTYPNAMSEGSPAAVEHDSIGGDMSTSPRRRAYSTNQIEDYNPQRKVYTPSDPSSALGKNPLRRAKVQELITHTNPDHGVQWKVNYQPQLANLCAASSRGRGLIGPRPPQQDGSHGETKSDPAPPVGTVYGPSAEDGSRSSTDSHSLGSMGEAAEGYGHQLCEAEAPQEPRELGGRATSCEERACKVVVTGLLGGKPVKWEVTFDIEPYQKGREREEKVHEDLWNETFHHLAARSIIRDFEQMAGKECEIEHGSGRRYQLYAIQTSKACNILSKYTAFVPIDLDSNEYLPTSIEYLHTGEELKRGSHSSSRSGSRKTRGYSVGLGRLQSGCMAEGDVETHPPRKTTQCYVSQRSPSATSDQSQRSVEGLFSARLSLTRTRLLTKAARGFMCRTPGRSGDSLGDGDNDSRDYIPLVSLQLSCGAFTLDAALCEAINVPMDKLKWTSPFSSHRVSLAHISHTSSRRSDSLEVHHSTSPPPRDPDLSFESEEAWPCSPSATHPSQSPRAESTSSLSGALPSASCEVPVSLGSGPYDSGRGSELDTPPSASPGGAQRAVQEPEGMVWATAVALAWLENNSASYFIEWELIAAKASLWLGRQVIPEGRNLAAVKAAANQLFIILRHWDENLQLNMLCYNPSSV
ncbi:hypothetical protein P4O66_020881 [Electrophorus voltai]|uniref:von Willebrand factor A domain containing 5B1 n=1 Tax=Electrophorus voltai TaxID=2609070 RepID=A0AAD8ZQ74_9TELE|nr:hypothetical protein P4O66_020881 [Electrophorus voltai]